MDQDVPPRTFAKQRCTRFLALSLAMSCLACFGHSGLCGHMFVVVVFLFLVVAFQLLDAVELKSGKVQFPKCENQEGTRARRQCHKCRLDGKGVQV